MCSRQQKKRGTSVTLVYIIRSSVHVIGARGQDLYPAFQYVNATFDTYHSNTIDGAVQEYCNLKGDAQMESFENTFKGLFSYVNVSNMILNSFPSTHTTHHQ
ncbi:hypothetical protein AVEN_211536-1 [Araneus ventricosus]|uniref:Uncharacterized protein n=1 Tax=Araneus ventricosus TaxID=182803 RepID=A0A4Y2U1K4_ARAVE|nr:hypothetical protein AVEN_211536-1 [Araneus ventricosus]